MTVSSSPLSRRRFMALGSSAALSLPVYGKSVLGANERVRFALIGCGGRGRDLVSRFIQVPQTQLVAVCDPDTQHMDSLVRKLEKGSKDTKGISGIEKIQGTFRN